MNKYISIGIVILVLSIFAAIEAVAPAQDKNASETSFADTPHVTSQTNNITKLDIIPQYGNVRLQPGESKETTVTVKNNEDKPVSVQPNITAMPYGTYTIDTNWIKITPSSVEIPAGESVKLTINVSVPKDTTVGSSGVQIAFTNEIMSEPYPQPVPYPQAPPVYAHVFQLSIDVWKQPNIQAYPSYVSDQIEAGKEYDYELKVYNIGNRAIEISPKLMNEVYYGPYGVDSPILDEKSITITAPGSIPTGTIETIKIHVDVPAGVTGYYNGHIDLRPADPSTQEGEGRISLNFNIWKQPTEPFTKTFILEKFDPITIEISSYYNNYPYLNTKKEEPSFNTNIVGPEGEAKLNITKTVIKGNVNMVSDRPSWDIGNVSPYQDNGGQNIVTYRTDGSPGEWRLNILPNNTMGFDYSIIIGEDK